MSSKFLVYVVKIGDPEYCHYTMPFQRDYCARYGYDLIYGSDEFSPRAPSWQKLMVYRFPATIGREFVLLMDLDIAPLPTAPPIHEALDFRCLNLVEEKWSNPLKIAVGWFKSRGADVNKVRHFNGGLIGLPLSLASFAENIYIKAQVDASFYWEQGDLTLAIDRQKPPLHVLDPKWNCGDHIAKKRLGKRLEEHCYFPHFNGHQGRRMRGTRALWEHYYGESLPKAAC